MFSTHAIAVYLGALEPPKVAASAEGAAATADEPIDAADPDFLEFMQNISKHHS